MRPVRVAINGFGRIGRVLARQLLTPNLKNFFELVAINDLASLDNLLYLFEYDSVHGHLSETLLPILASQGNNWFTVNNFPKIKVFSERSPVNLPWRELDVDIVVDCSGVWTTYSELYQHIGAGAKRVVLSAPSKDKEILTFTPNVNEENLKSNHLVTSNASCTTNAAAPIIKAILRPLGIRYIGVDTVHAYTTSQPLTDSPFSKKDLRGNRAASENITPSSTGAIQAIPLLFPELKGKVDGQSVRVPVPDGSFLMLTAEVDKQVQLHILTQMLDLAALDGEWRRRKILGVTDKPLVSKDIIGNEYGSLVDRLSASVNGNHIRICSWYDNEWGYTAMLLQHMFKVAQTAKFVS